MELSNEQVKALVSTLKTRFQKNMNRHPAIDWEEVERVLKSKNYH